MKISDVILQLQQIAEKYPQATVCGDHINLELCIGPNGLQVEVSLPPEKEEDAQ